MSTLLWSFECLRLRYKTHMCEIAERKWDIIDYRSLEEFHTRFLEWESKHATATDAEQVHTAIFGGNRCKITFNEECPRNSR